MIEESAIRDIVVRLARPARSGGHTVERAAMLAEGADFGDIEAWIISRGGSPQEPAGAKPSGGGGLHGDRDRTNRMRASAPPARYVLPASALEQSPA